MKQTQLHGNKRKKNSKSEGNIKYNTLLINTIRKKNSFLTTTVFPIMNHITTIMILSRQEL